jgi:hypothetical protein
MDLYTPPSSPILPDFNNFYGEDNTALCECPSCDMIFSLSGFINVCSELAEYEVEESKFEDKIDPRLACCVQSEDVASSGIDTQPQSASNTTQEQNVGFTDQDNNVISSMPHPMNYSRVDTSQNVALGQYLKRPVQIYSKSWTIGSTLDAATDEFLPWSLFFSRNSIARKLDNYYMLRCNMHLKVVVNASPFYYGCAMLSYQPLLEFNPAGTVVSAANKLENVSLSQRPHMYIYPQDSQGGEMVLPFLYYKNWLDATRDNDLRNMGRITLSSFGPLLNANGLTTDSIDIVVYAWAEDIEVAGPTVALAVQSSDMKKKGKLNTKDEYSHDGVISKPASAIARAAGYLQQVPVIGPFATATSMVATAIGNAASIFGYTDVPVIDDVHQFRTHPYPALASTDIGTPIEKLTLDAKNELSIDPKIVGVNVEDEMNISSLVGRESFLFESTWSASDAATAGLFYSKVGPSLIRREAITNGFVTWPTPMWLVAQNFSHWRGDIIYRFKFICSQYHRGRAIVNWDPHGDIGTAGEYATETYSRIIDITEETDVEFCVPYTQLTAYLDCFDGSAESVFQSSTNTSGINRLWNGILTIRVLTPQTSPVSSADIKILTFVRGAPNLEFAAPRKLKNTYSPYAIQSDDIKIDQGVSEYQLGVQPSMADPNINTVYMGETVVSIRQLIRRSAMYYRMFAAGSSADVFASIRFKIARSPLYPGFDPAGLNLATGLTSAVDESYNYVNWHPVTWFSQCFVGHRGSYHYTFNPHHNELLKSVTIARTTATHTASNAVKFTSIASTATGSLQREFSNFEAYETGMAGMSLTNQTSLSGNMVSLPMYSRYKFQDNSIGFRTEGNPIDDTDTDCMEVILYQDIPTGHDFDRFYIDLYMSAGTDFNLVFFLNVPSLYEYNAYPVAP